MRCSRCQQIAVPEVAECPNCGHQLSDGGAQREIGGLDLGTEMAPLGPLRDYPLQQQVGSVAPPVRHFSLTDASPHVPPFSFASTHTSTSPRPNLARPRPRSVRRQTLEVVKFRTSPTRVPVQELGLQFEGAELGATSHDPREATSAVEYGASILARRFVAGLVDTLILFGIDAAVMLLTVRVAGLSLASATQLPVFPVATFLLLFDTGYLVVLTALGGQTIGKMAVRLRVVGGDGSPVALTRAIVRTAACVLAVLPAGLGYVGILLPFKRALHDVVADTRVVKVS